jgi:hypothetical protein
MSVIHDDWVTAIGLPLVEVEEAVRREASSRAQAPRNTTGRVVQGNVVGLEPSCSRIDGRPCDCYTIAIDQQLAGAPIDSSEVVVMMPSEYYRKRWEWRGLFILGEVPGDTRFKVMDPRRQLIEEVSGQYVVGYQIVSSTWLDRVAPITVPLSEVRE